MPSVQLADRLKLFGVRFRDLALDLVLEFLLKGHDQLDRVERVGAEIIKKGGIWRDLLLIDVELVHNDLFNALVYGFLVSHLGIIQSTQASHCHAAVNGKNLAGHRSEEHTSELQS